MNARYAISIARRLGALIFMLPEDIVKGHPRMLKVFMGSVLGLIITAQGQ